jgi:hypothetical protein
MIVELSYCTVLFKYPVTTLRFKENAELDVKEIREIFTTVDTLNNGRPGFVLTDARVDLTITAEGRKIAADKEEFPSLVANAVVLNSLPVKLTANFFLKFNKPHFKLRIFNTEEKAMEWLINLSLKSKNRVPEKV